MKTYICFISYDKIFKFIIVTYLRVMSIKCKSTWTLNNARNFLYLFFLYFLLLFFFAKDFCICARFWNDNTSFSEFFPSSLKTTSKKTFYKILFSFDIASALTTTFSSLQKFLLLKFSLPESFAELIIH